MDVLFAFYRILCHDRFEGLVALLEDVASVVAPSSVNLIRHQEHNHIASISVHLYA